MVRRASGSSAFSGGWAAGRSGTTWREHGGLGIAAVASSGRKRLEKGAEMFAVRPCPRAAGNRAAVIAVAVTLLTCVPSVRAETTEVSCDVCVYGATPSGILAAVAVSREGRSAVIVEPSRWVGGILGAGLKPTQDCPNIHATGGLTRSLLTSLGQPIVEIDGRETRGHVGNPELNPRDIRRDFLVLLEQHDVRVIYNHRVSSCEKQGPETAIGDVRSRAVRRLGLPAARPEQVAASVFGQIYIDASYDGDLMSRAGVAYRVGRESAEAFGEELAGVQPPMEAAPIDPFVDPGNPEQRIAPLGRERPRPTDWGRRRLHPGIQLSLLHHR